MELISDAARLFLPFLFFGWLCMLMISTGYLTNRVSLMQGLHGLSFSLGLWLLLLPLIFGIAMLRRQAFPSASTAAYWAAGLSFCIQAAMLTYRWIGKIMSTRGQMSKVEEDTRFRRFGIGLWIIATFAGLVAWFGLSGFNPWTGTYDETFISHWAGVLSLTSGLYLYLLGVGIWNLKRWAILLWVISFIVIELVSLIISVVDNDLRNFITTLIIGLFLIPWLKSALELQRRGKLR